MRTLGLVFGIMIAALGVMPGLASEAPDAITIPAGTTLEVRLNTLLSTRTSHNGDPFTARVAEPVFAGGQEVVPAGSTLEGHITYLKEPGRAKGKAEMRLVADSITTPDDVHFDLRAGLEEAEGANGSKVSGEEGTLQGPGKSTKGAAVETGVGAGIGAGVGAIAGGGKGSLYGLGAGAVVGLIHNMSRKHQDVVLPTGTEMTFVVSRTTTAKRIAKPVVSGNQ